MGTYTMSTYIMSTYKERLRAGFKTGYLCFFITLSTEAVMGQSEQVDPFYPRVVTEVTRADSEALARLEAPGEVFFTDDFETDASFDKYFEVRGLDDGRARRVGDDTAAYSGQGAMRFAAPQNDGNASGSGASLWFGPQGYEVVYFRRHIKFAADYDQGNLNHTGGGLAGVVGADRWGGMGKAGIRPQGDDRFTSSFEPWRDWQRYAAPGFMFFYAYWMDMKKSSDGNYWGNHIEPPPENRFVPERDRWYCLEQMIRVNDLGQANGELAGWIDGRLYLHATGFRWRTVEDLKIKRADIGIYIHQATRDNVVWYDDVALSTGYIGPADAGSTAVDRATWGDVKNGGR